MSDVRWQIDEIRIATLAYGYWEERGRPEGSPEVDRHRAVAALSTPTLDLDAISAFAFGPDTGAR
jgi:DUF2934 family protein